MNPWKLTVLLGVAFAAGWNGALYYYNEAVAKNAKNLDAREEALSYAAEAFVDYTNEIAEGTPREEAWATFTEKLEFYNITHFSM